MAIFPWEASESITSKPFRSSWKAQLSKIPKLLHVMGVCALFSYVFFATWGDLGGFYAFKSLSGHQHHLSGGLAAQKLRAVTVTELAEAALCPERPGAKSSCQSAASCKLNIIKHLIFDATFSCYSVYDFVFFEPFDLVDEGCSICCDCQDSASGRSGRRWVRAAQSSSKRSNTSSGSRNTSKNFGRRGLGDLRWLLQGLMDFIGSLVPEVGLLLRLTPDSTG